MKNSISSTKNIFNFSIIISAIILLLVIFNNKSYSQVTFCYPDCFYDLWAPPPPAPPLEHQITLPCGEPVIVKYRLRHACNSIWDIFIEEIEFVNGYSGGANCGLTMTIAQMLEAAMTQLIYDNPMHYPPTDSTKDTCVTNYRVLVGGCWHPTFPIGPGDSMQRPPVIDAPAGLLIPCVFIECCTKSFTVCYVNGTKIIIYDAQNSTLGACDYKYQPSCYPACE